MKKNFRTMMLAMATLGLFSCADKLADDTTQQSQTGSADGFVAFQISQVGVGTRAAGERPDAESAGKDNDGNYDEGSPNEWAITAEQGANAAFFFNAETGAYEDMSQLQLMDDPVAGGNHSDEKLYSARLRKTEGTNYYCVIILNAKPTVLESLTNKNLATFMRERDAALGQYESGSDIFFTMSNTVYVDETDNNKVHGPENIPSEKIHKTWEDAQKDKVTVHVERVVAKFDVNIQSTTGEQTALDDKSILITYTVQKDNSGANPVYTGCLLTPATTENDQEGILVDGYSSWGIRIKNWAVNAQETATYFTKNLFENLLETTWTTPTPAVENNGNFGYWDLTYSAASFGWNDQSRVRSYWAVDPHYNSEDDVYPRQYRKAFDNTGLPYYEANKQSVLSYINYNGINGNLGSALYAPENTFGDYSNLGDESKFGKTTGDNDYEFSGDRYRWTSTHILVAAELLLGDEMEKVKNDNNYQITDKYCFEGVYWTEEQTGEGQATLINKMFSTLMYIYGNLYADSKGETLLKETDGKDYFKLDPATIDGGDGRLMLSLTNTLYKKVVKDDGDIEYEEVTPTDWQEDTEFAKAISQCTVQHFSKGKMYYAIPIEHMVAYAKDPKTGKTTKFNIGSFGVVRNHWYKVNITKISSPGTPVDKPEEEIVPNDDPKEVSYIAFQIVIIPWHVINQGVEF